MHFKKKGHNIIFKSQQNSFHKKAFKSLLFRYFVWKINAPKITVQKQQLIKEKKIHASILRRKKLRYIVPDNIGNIQGPVTSIIKSVEDILVCLQ